MGKEWSKEQIEAYKADHSNLKDVSDEIIIECLEFEDENGTMSEIYCNGIHWEKEEIK